MGTYAIDQYSLLHFAVGIVAYFWGISAVSVLVLHVVFELVENTPMGMNFINTYIPFWPGGKPYADSVLNQVSDTLMTMIGWILSQRLDALSIEKHLYPG
jgi:hypothetical protein